MQLRMIRTIYWKDMRDAIRDARVLVAVVVPIALGVFYNLTIDDTTTQPQPEARLVYAVDGQSMLPAAIEEQVAGVVDLEIRPVEDADAVRRILADEEAELGLIIPAGFDEAVAAGQTPALPVVLPEQPGLGADVVVGSLEPALRAMAGQAEAATLRVETSLPGAEPDTFTLIFDQLGFGTYLVLATVIFLVGMIAMLAVPIILAEEAEKKTLDALILIASYRDVVVAKALVGITYVIVAVGIQLALTRLAPENALLFWAGILALAVALIGFGLLMGAIFRNANQLNTWSGVLLIPVLAPAFLVGAPLPDPVPWILDAFPTSQGMKLVVNGFAGQTIFDGVWLSFLVLAIWAVAGYALLLRLLARRQA